MARLLTALLATVLTAPAALADGLHQAPSLDAAVSGGTLPPVEQRLPKEPQVVTPTKSVGRYGGTLRSALRGDADHNAILRLVGNQGLTRWSPDYESVAPNLAARWTRNADASEWTFTLRPGTRWSDGQPFTVDDVLFNVGLLNNTAFFAAPPSQYTVNGRVMRAEKVDDSTVKLIMGGPFLRLPEVLAAPLGQHPTLYAKHYCEQFTPANPKVADLVTQYRQSDWAGLLRLRCGDIEIPARWANPDKPVLDPWVVQTPYTGGATQVVLRRNPYFWQVDTAGNQLPYIDTLNLRIISDIQSIALAAIGGQLDLMVRHINTINNKPVLAEHADAAGYVLQAITPAEATAGGLWINQTEKDPKLRKLLTDHDFRQALSLAIDREEISDIVYLGQSKPWQTGPLPQDKFYNKQLAEQYTQHDPAAANAILDKLGLKRVGSGMRTYPDGSRLFMTAEASLSDPGMSDVLELIKKQWATVGIDVGIKTEERSLYYDRGQNNDYDIQIQPLPGGLDPTSDPRQWLSIHTLDSRQSLQWVKWYASGGKGGEEPSPSMKERLALWDQYKQATDPAQADALFKQILQKAADAFEVIGTVQAVTTFGVHNKTLANVPDSMPNAWTYPTPAPTLLQQYYFTR